jgi:hypothetical protein
VIVRHLSLVVAAVALLCGKQEAMCGNVVVESTTDVLQVGQLLDSSQTVTLPPGTFVTLIGDDGKIIRLVGPYTGQAAQVEPIVRNPNLVGTISHPVGGKESDGISFGGIRNADPADPPGSDEIDVSRTGHHCLIRGELPSFRRGKGVRSHSYVIKDAAAGISASVSFDSDAVTAPWPAELKPRDNATYWLWDPDEPSAKRLTVHLRAARGSRDIWQVARLADIGCTQQARTLLKELLDSR